MSETRRKRLAPIGIGLWLALTSVSATPWGSEQTSTAAAGWPAATNETKPWTRWWWLGAAVDPETISRELESFRAAGFGGVEITPIYGVRGAESRFVPYLSDEWVRRLEHTLREARRLGLGVDMATGTGWPFGGPWVTEQDASRGIVSKMWTVEGGARLAEPVRLLQTPLKRAVGEALEQVRDSRPLPLVVLMAYGSNGDIVDLTARVGRDELLDWTAPAGRWTLYGVFLGWHGKMVERAAPGGEGSVIDHFSRDAIARYLAPFNRALAGLPRASADGPESRGRDLAGLRAFFNDSYEVDDATGQADWTPALFDEFQKRRGYDLRRHLPALLGRDTSADSARVLADYRETISDLLLETFTTEWSGWARQRGALVRNQAHGSPANLLDLYAASDIPETEGTEFARSKWASSAASVAGRRLVSAEAATWLGEHFRSTLADVRADVDRFFLAGVNHIVYHGTAASPAGDPWPGWLFYAAVEFNARNPWWDDLPALNAYIARVQSFLQAGRPDHDVLLYYPFYDSLTLRGNGLLAHFGGASQPLEGTAFEAASEVLQRRGYTFDYISDRQLRALRSTDRTIVLPASRFIPLDTLEHVVTLARAGARVIVFRDWPADVSGLHDPDARRARLRQLIAEGRGRVMQGDDLESLLARARVSRERLVDTGLQFVRRTDGGRRIYFLANSSGRDVDGWLPLDGATSAVVLFDPMRGTRGTARSRRAPDGATEIRLQLPAGESLIVVVGADASAENHRVSAAAGERSPVSGPWTVRFVSGGPTLPPERTVERLASWTTFGGNEVRAFSGTAVYSTRFARPPGAASAWRLDLGRVHDSARVRMNGRDYGTLIGPRFQIVVGPDALADQNVLEISVTNLMANRIASMDRAGVPWKKFYNINFPSRLPENRGPDGLFTAAKWAPLDSGLLGPVQLTPLQPGQ